MKFEIDVEVGEYISRHSKESNTITMLKILYNIEQIAILYTYYIAPLLNCYCVTMKLEGNEERELVATLHIA
jgi:hypothetical protein